GRVPDSARHVGGERRRRAALAPRARDRLQARRPRRPRAREKEARRALSRRLSPVRRGRGGSGRPPRTGTESDRRAWFAQQRGAMVGRVHAPGDRRDHDRRRRFVVWLGLSALLHLPMTPVFGLVGLLGLLKPPDDDDVPSGPPIVAIPIDLLEEPAPEATQPPAPSEPAAPPMAVEAPPEPEAPKPLPPKPKPPEPAPPAEEPAKAPESGIADPVAMA